MATNFTLMNLTSLNSTEESHPFDDNISFETYEAIRIVVPILILGLLGNGFVCFAFYHYPSVRSLTNYVIVNLAFADLLLVTVLMLWLILFVIKESSGHAYNMLVSIDVLCTSLSMLNLALVGIDRYIAVVYALRYPTIVTKKRVKRCLVLIWTFSLVVATIAFSRQFVDDKPSRLLFNAAFMTVWALVIFVVPMCVIFFSYAKVFIAAWKQIEWTEKHTNQENHHKKREVIKKEIRLSLNLLIIVIPFCTMWGIYFGITLYEAFCTEIAIDASAKVLFVIGILPHIVASVNPIIYIFLTKDMRKALKKFITAPMRRLSMRKVGMTKTTTLQNIFEYLGGNITARSSKSENPSNKNAPSSADNKASASNLDILDGKIQNDDKVPTRL
ncbi:histamine H2 receptor-like [Actinia tenebrosa]|uniref:Histamine H2 receptor-like n=1 Tax=Actinia tenebrosa TaxID=6105 RepID=A0A6P8IUH4_ACTTE|nr:histamine H2 receptor-like [Actinia tenebrosa]XP_031570592.1 histamine H2 receptor-like [Actinia tenebrosa]